MISQNVVELLAGGPVDNTWEPVFMLLTVDEDGYSRVCLLSRGELDIHEDTIRCVIRSRRTGSNLQRNGQATLVVTGDMSVFYCRLNVIRSFTKNFGVLAVVFSVLSEEVDSADIPLQTMRFLATRDLREREKWEDNRTLLNQFNQ